MTSKILDKLAKMKAMEEGERAVGNTEAAEAFAAAINRMLLTHDLEMSDIEFAKKSEDEPIIEHHVNLREHGIEPKKMRVEWQQRLAGIVARFNMCRNLSLPRSNRVWFVGTRDHVAVAEYTFVVLVRAAETMSHKEYCDFWWRLKREKNDTSEAAGFKAAWLNAFIARIWQRLNTQQQDMTATNVSTGSALMRINQSLARVDDYMDAAKKSGQHTSLARINGRSSSNAEGARRGREAADRIALNKGVGGGSTKTAAGLLR